jgi:hypothetical protein
MYFFIFRPKFFIYMKKALLFTLLAAFCAFFFFSKNTDTPVKIPASANEENKKERAAWDLMRLADPSTGKIPEGIAFRERQFAAQMPVAVEDRNLVANWTTRGPWNVGGRTRQVVLDVNDPNHIMAGGVSGGIWESLDAGQSWARRTPMNAHPGVVSIAQDPRPGKTNNWYYLSGEIVGTSASGGASFYLGDGMFKSTDNGTTWSVLGATDNGNPMSFTELWQSGWKVVVDPVAPDNLDILYAATYGAIWRSTNGGTSWVAVRGGNGNNSYFTDVAITSTGVLYATMSSAGAQKGIWRSTNGTAWTKINPGTGFPATFDRIVIGVNPNDENEVYFLASTPGTGHVSSFIGNDDWTSLWKYKYVSGDGTGTGGEWTTLSDNLPNMGTEFDRFSAQGGYDLVVKVQPGTNHVFVGGTSLYRSTDGFTSPNNTTQIGGYKPGTTLPFFELYPNHHPDVHDVIFHPTLPNVMITASDGGLHRTENCNAPVVEWAYLNNGYRTSQFYTAIIEKSTPNDSTIIGGLQDNGNFFVNSNDPTSVWKQTVNGDGAYGAIPDGKPFTILSIQQGRLAKCNINDQGDVLAFRRFDPVGPKKDDYLFINPLAIDPIDQNKLYLPAGRHLYRQDDLAAIDMNGQWDSIAQGWTKFPDTLVAINDNEAANNFSAIAVSSAPAHRVYLGTTRGQLYRIDNADTGTPSMVTLPKANANATAYVTCIAIDPDNADNVVVAYSNYNTYSIYQSVNGGNNWTKVAGNLESNTGGSGNGPSVRWVSILPLPDGSRKYFCGTSVGLYSADTLIAHVTTNGGTQWALEAPDLIGATVINHIETRASDGLVVVATHGIGMFSANFEPVNSSNEPNGNNGTAKVFPNPATDFVHFQWPEPDNRATLRMYSATGQLVRHQPVGNGNDPVPVNDLPKGVLFYELTGRDWAKRGKVVVR